jgi:branched-chain amino acid transport system ATP-binding protein
MSGTTPILIAEDLCVNYGPAKAVFDVSLSIEPGSAVTILGSNGAGKSSLARALCGLVAPASGKVVLDSKDVTGWSANRIAHLGLTYVPEGRGVFAGLSVVDNLRMCLRQGGKKNRDAKVEKAFELFPVLGERRYQRAGTLSGGEQQMLSLARVLAGRPSVVIADEPSLGLAPLLIDMVFDSLEQARQAGMTVILIEQFVHRALGFADRCLVMQRGRLSWDGRSSEAKSEVLARYLGSEAPAGTPALNGDRSTVG